MILKHLMKTLIILAGCMSLFSCSGNKNFAPLLTVPNVEIQRYMGLWYEYTSIPAFFQRGCTQTTARYDLLADGSVRVDNKCISRGKRKGIVGTARSLDSTNAKLEVRFKILGFIPTKGDYWVLGLGPIGADGLYSWAVVGEPRRKFGWLLSRTKDVSPQTLARAKFILQDSGYDLTKFKKTVQ